MKCTTVLHGGVCHRTSTPHKSGNKMNEKKKTGAMQMSVLCLSVTIPSVQPKNAVTLN